MEISHNDPPVEISHKIVEYFYSNHPKRFCLALLFLLLTIRERLNKSLLEPLMRLLFPAVDFICGTSDDVRRMGCSTDDVARMLGCSTDDVRRMGGSDSMKKNP